MAPAPKQRAPETVKEHFPKCIYRRNQQSGKIEDQVVRDPDAFAAAIDEGWVESPADCEDAAPPAPVVDEEKEALRARVAELEAAAAKGKGGKGKDKDE